MKSKHKLIQILRTLFTTGLAYVVNYGILLVLTPYITETVGTEAYGFVSLAKQFTQYAVVLTMALNTFAARYISIAYHNGDIKTARVYFSSVFWGDTVLATAILLIVAVIFPFLDGLLHIPTAISTDVKLLFLFTFLNFWVTTVFSVFGCAGYIKNKLDLTGVFKTLSYITEAFVLVVAYVLFPAKVLYVGIGAVAAALVIAGTDYWMTRKFTPELRARRKDFSVPAVKRLVMDGCWASISSLGDMLNNGLDLIVCNQMLTGLAMGQLAIAKTMNSIVQSLYAIVNQAFIPMFLKSYAANDKDQLLKELRMSMKFSGFLANILFAGFFALGMVYYKLWIPEQDIELIYWLTIVTIMTCIPNGAIHPLYYIYTLTVKRKVPCFVTLTGGVFNVVGMYVLIRFCGMGVYAVAWTTVVVMCVINFITNPLYMAHVLHLPAKTFYPNIVRNVLACLAMVLVFKGLTMLYMPASWLTLVLSAAVLVVVGLPVHFVIVCNRQELHEYVGMAKSFLASKKV